MSIFDKLNSPKVVLFVLALILAVNGFLLYRQQATPTATGQPRTEIIVVPANSAPEAPEEARKPEQAQPEQGGQTQEQTEERTQERTQERIQERTQERTRSEPDPEQDPPPRPETARVELGGLGEAMGRCNREAEECVREFVASAAPEAKYIGGRTNLEVGRDSEVLYFETPALGECEHVRQAYQSAGETTYTVVVMGQGSFQSPRGSECIPKA